MSCSVHLLAEAESDFAELYGFLYNRSPSGAANWAQAFQSGISRLRTRPETCGLADESSALRQDVRQLLFQTKHGRTYRAIFTWDADCVTILRIRGPGQRPLKGSDLPTV